MPSELISRGEFNTQREWLEKEFNKCIKTDTMDLIRDSLAKKIDTVNRQDMKDIYEVLDKLNNSIHEIAGKVSKLEAHITDAPTKKCIEQMYDIAEEEVSRRSFNDGTIRKIAKEVYREFKKEEAEESLERVERKLGIAGNMIKLLSLIIPVLLFLYVIAQHRIIDNYMKNRQNIEMIQNNNKNDEHHGSNKADNNEE